jgi:hypothetical protein
MSADALVQARYMSDGRTATERSGGYADGSPWVRKSGSNGSRLYKSNMLSSYWLSLSPQNLSKGAASEKTNTVIYATLCHLLTLVSFVNAFMMDSV